MNPSQVEVGEAIDAITRGAGADVVVEAAGYPDTLNMALRVVRQFGTVIIFGIPSEDYVPIEHHWLMDKQARIIPTTGARSGDAISHIREIVGLRQRGWCGPRDGCSPTAWGFPRYKPPTTCTNSGRTRSSKS